MGPRHHPLGGEAKLGKLLHFDAGTRPATPVAEQGDGSVTTRPPAEIVLFTGVRYERDGTLPDKPAGSATGGKQRRG